MKKENGITLIALVITIIVLLILAGITLGLSLSQNGIISKSKEAVNTHREAETSEQVSMNEAMDYWDTFAGAGSGISAAQIKADPSTYYGKKVVYDAKGYTWRIYCSDGTNVYITTEGYINTSDYPNGKGGVAAEDISMDIDEVSANYNPLSDISDEVKPLLSKYYEVNGGNDDLFNTINMQGTAYLLDTNAWSGFKTQNAKYAIGAPTIELLASAYKDLHVDTYMETNVTAGDNGYRMKFNTDETWSTYIDLDATASIVLSPEGTSYDFTGQWIAGPGYVSDPEITTTQSSMYKMWTGGGITLMDSGYGIRPIVCLPSVELAEE